MHQFNVGLVDSLYFVSVQSDGQPQLSVDATQSLYREVAMESAGFVVLLSSLLLFCFSFSNWKLPGQNSRPPGRRRLSPEHLPLDEQLFRLPCARCRYFQANIYLACAVNPLQVLKPEAMNCSDFQHKTGGASHDCHP